MKQLDNFIPKKILSEDSIRTSYVAFKRELARPENRGGFPAINPSKLEEVNLAFRNELSRYAYSSLVDDDNLGYQNIITGLRQYKRYIFAVDTRNSLNKEIQKSTNCSFVKLDFIDKTSYTFYLILNPLDLDALTTTFFRWLNLIAEPAD